MRMKATDDFVKASANPSAASATSSKSLMPPNSAQAAWIPSSAPCMPTSSGSAVATAVSPPRLGLRNDRKLNCQSTGSRYERGSALAALPGRMISQGGGLGG